MNSRSPDHDFYVGYRTDNAPSQRRFTRLATLLLFIFSLGLATLLATLQQRFDPGLFEFGIVRTVEGTLHLTPRPHITLDQPLALPAAGSRAGTDGTARELLLVAPGKHGAHDLDALAGQAVTARGSLIVRDDVAMLELAEPPTAREGVAPTDPPDPVERRRVRLTGEIVDTKCFLGVMKPGRGKVHRACATLCLEGGIPPAFLVRDGQGKEWIALLLDSQGEAPRNSLAAWVGEAITLEGWVHVRRDGVAEFRVDLESQLL